MLALISPAKTLDYQSAVPDTSNTQPQLLAETQQLIAICRQLSPTQLASLMKISDKLASLNAVRFQQWHLPFTDDNARAAILAFKGDVYTGLQAEDFSRDDFAFAQDHLAILSGLYGLLRPLDLMQPYRLEMGTALANPRGHNLYAFWGNIISQHLAQQLQQQCANVLVNLASDEYFTAVKAQQLPVPVIKPIFLDEKQGKFKVISFYAKKARGLMCRFIVKERLTDVQQLKEFELAGYQFAKEQSTAQQWVFKRTEQAQ